MKQYKFVLYLCLCLSFSIAGHAQRYLGVANSEYSDMNNLYLNPANIAGTKEKITISVFALNLGVDNSLGTLTSLGNISNAINNSNSTSGSGLFQNSGHTNFSMLLPAAEIRGPGIMIKINDKQSIALTTRIRVINQLNNFDQSLFSNISNPNFSANNNYSVSAKNFNWTAHLWSELGLTYGIVLLDNPNGQLKAGLTLRYLGGIGYLCLKGNNLDMNFKSGQDSFYASHSDLQYSSNILTTSNTAFSNLTPSTLLSSFFGSKEGSGLGADLGIVYAFNPGGTDIYADDYTGANSYKIKLSASVTDIGAINYNAQNNTTVNVTGNGYLTGAGLKANVKNADGFENYIQTQGFNGDTGSKVTKLYLPTALLLSADYNVYKRFFVNATYINNLANQQNFGNSYYNQITVTPRFDTKIFTIGVPITYSMLADDVKMGLGIRVGGFFIGSDDMLALFSNRQYGFDFYFGGYIPIFSKASNTVPAG